MCQEHRAIRERQKNLKRFSGALFFVDSVKRRMMSNSLIVSQAELNFITQFFPSLLENSRVQRYDMTYGPATEFRSQPTISATRQSCWPASLQPSRLKKALSDTRMRYEQCKLPTLKPFRPTWLKSEIGKTEEIKNE